MISRLVVVRAWVLLVGGSSYMLTSGDVGHMMRAVVTATNCGGSSNQTGTVAAQPLAAPSNIAVR